MASAASTATRLSQAALARALGVSRQAIHDLVRRGIIQVDADGQIDVAAARAALMNSVRPSGKTGAALAATPPPGQSPPTTQPPALEATSFHVARTLREAAEAQIAQLKLAEMQRNLIEAKGAVRATHTAFRALRDGAQVIGRKIAPTLAGMSDAREIQAAIDAAVAELFTVFAKRTLASLSAQITGGQAVDLPDEGPT